MPSDPIWGVARKHAAMIEPDCNTLSVDGVADIVYDAIRAALRIYERGGRTTSDTGVAVPRYLGQKRVNQQPVPARQDGCDT